MYTKTESTPLNVKHFKRIGSKIKYKKNIMLVSNLKICNKQTYLHAYLMKKFHQETVG